MAISHELLQKAAKVYDCSEPVEGMKPKMQYEEHKDLTPDEFSREHTNKAEEKSSALLASLHKLAASTPATKAAQYGSRAAHAILPIMEREFKKQSASPFDLGFTQSGAPTASWANKGYNPHQAINTPAATTPSGHMGNANRARFQFATAGSPQAKIDAQTAFTQAARATNSSNVALGGKPQYSPTQQPMQ